MMQNINRNNYLRKMNDDRPTKVLIQEALQEMLNEDAEWPAFGELRFRGWLEDFEEAKSLCQSDDAKKRELGSGILGSPMRKAEYVEESVQILLNMLKDEHEPKVVNSIGISLGHLQDERAVEPLVKLKNHPSAEVRFGVVFGLMHHDNPLAIQTLIELSQDTDEDVRDYATFGLGSLQEEVDTEALREALLKNIDDPHTDTRYEALMGLALRRDKRILNRVMEEIISGQVDIDSFVGDIFCEMLKALKDEISDPRLPEILEQCD